MTTFTIPAECHTDDHAIKIPFDALKWFEQASNQEITALSDCGWRGDYAADAVAQESAVFHPSLNTIFDYKGGDKNHCGFECSVDEDKALAWLILNKPTLHSSITC